MKVSSFMNMNTVRIECHTAEINYKKLIYVEEEKKTYFVDCRKRRSLFWLYI